MCGIVGYVGEREAAAIVVEGLKRLEYRGYDSAGVAAGHNGAMGIVKSAGKIAVLEARLAAVGLKGRVAIGHTRWATHGPPTEANAHPHTDGLGRIAVVHNGIFENARPLRQKLEAEGVRFQSETDTEVLAHLIRNHWDTSAGSRADDGDGPARLASALRAALRELRGSFAVAVMSADAPGAIVAARHGGPLIIGIGDGEMHLASDAPAIMRLTRRVIYLPDEHHAVLKAGGYHLETLEGEPAQGIEERITWDEESAEKGGYPHFMLKEIEEQPAVIRGLLRTWIGDGAGTEFEPARPHFAALKSCPKVFIVACGTALHAGMVGARLIERVARVPVEVCVASEFRYREPLVPAGSIVIPVSQSGETADTLEAMRLARSLGAGVLSVVNVVGSSVARESDGVLQTQAGPEIGVASTKAYTAQLTVLTLLALAMAKARGALPPNMVGAALAEMSRLPELLQRCIDGAEEVQRIAAQPKYREPRSAFFMARGLNVPSAYEGALKLKEISYIHAEGYAAGEMKHGPIALITNEVPMVCIAPQDSVRDKTLGNIQEIRARGGIVLSIGTEGDDEIRALSDDVIYIPQCADFLSPILAAAPLQLFAYHVAVNRGCDVDQPRNLAKSVTVE